jgi:hypothetical protein
MIIFFFIFNKMAAYDENLEPLPEQIENIRRPNSIYNNPHRFYQPDIGRLHGIREELARRASLTNVQQENLQETLASKSGKGTGRQRKLPEKEGVPELYRIVQDMKRDIKFIREAQSEAGANHWIAQHGYGDKLYVDKKDIDNDGIPDIIVKKRSDRSPYIVKGYTTVDSGYPLRNAYYTEVPKDKRKEFTFRDFVKNISVDHYNKGGLSTTFNRKFIEGINRMRTAGYKIKPPSEKISAVTAFKMFIMKPLMKCIKEITKMIKAPFNLTAQKARTAEAYLRHNLVTEPVLVRIYGPEVLNVQDDKAMKKLMGRETVKSGIKDLTAYLIDNRIETPVQVSLSNGLLDILLSLEVIDQETRGYLGEVLDGYLTQYEPWQNDLLAR